MTTKRNTTTAKQDGGFTAYSRFTRVPTLLGAVLLGAVLLSQKAAAADQGGEAQGRQAHHPGGSPVWHHQRGFH